jgi:hypothetical protein
LGGFSGLSSFVYRLFYKTNLPEGHRVEALAKTDRITKQTQISVFHTENKDRMNMKPKKTKRTQTPERRSLDTERCFTKQSHFSVGSVISVAKTYLTKQTQFFSDNTGLNRS